MERPSAANQSTKRMKLWSLLLLFPCGWVHGQESEPNEPVVAARSEEAEQSLASIRLQGNLKGELVAAEPMVANPVAFTIDAAGRIYVCETFRQENGITDNRSHDETWTDHDLAAKTVADRIAYHHKLLPQAGREYTREQDRVRLLLDHNGDGRADESKIFADKFHALEDGTAAGVLPLGEHVFLTCIPNLWRLTDSDRNGIAESREKLLSGFGVRVAFRGHDLHGLIRGPDGRIYFSVGDRGYHVETREGQTLADPESGAVFRCELDGSGLEVFATGLRNPQELAFDEFGNLFTGDNNSDSGDRARWVHVVEGGDSGWRMAYQYLTDRGPFNREKIWHPLHPNQPTYVVPPIANFGDGPSGLAFYPGTGFASDFQGQFLLCDFRGGSQDSGVRAIRMRADGASFRLDSDDKPVWNILATDLEFGPDGFLYVSDWVSGWVGEGKGRIYRFADPSVIATDEVREVRALLAGGIRSCRTSQLANLLSHRDQRVRLNAQWELADRNAIAVFAEKSNYGHPLLARIHSLWGLSQIARRNNRHDLIVALSHLLKDREPEVRVAAAKLMSDHRIRTAERELICRLSDPSSRVRAAAAASLGKLQSEMAIEPLLRLLAENEDRDAVLRHCAIMGLAGISSDRLVQTTWQHPSSSVRRAAVVALRRQQSPLVNQFLTDADVTVAEEAARAIHDVPISDAQSALADAWNRFPDSLAFSHRAINANFRVGNDDAARRLAAVAVDSRFNSAVRSDAMWMLAHWSQPSARDRVLGMWRPLAPRSAEPAARALAEHLQTIIELKDDEMLLLALKSVGELKISSAVKDLVTLAADTKYSAEIRARALVSLSQLDANETVDLAAQSLDDSQHIVRTAAREILLVRGHEAAIDSLIAALDSAEVRERQAAFALLGQSTSPDAARAVEAKLRQLIDGRLPADTRLDLVLSAQALRANNSNIAGLLDQYKAADPDTVTREFRDCLEGGDAGTGRQIFFEKIQVYCLRCHRVADQGGAVGPDLTAIGSKKDRKYLMESIVDPNRAIAENYETVVIINDLGKTISGVLQSETDDFVRLTTAEGSLVTVAKSSIDERRRGKSSMPEDLVQHLTPREVRDLVEFLTQQGSPQAGRQPASEIVADAPGDQ